MSTQHKSAATRSQANLAIQPSLFTSMATPPASAFSAPHKSILEQESRYLCAWLRSRLEDGLWLPREESALSGTPQQRRQIARLARLARRQGLAMWPARIRTTRQEVA